MDSCVDLFFDDSVDASCHGAIEGFDVVEFAFFAREELVDDILFSRE